MLVLKAQQSWELKEALRLKFDNAFVQNTHIFEKFLNNAIDLMRHSIKLKCETKPNKHEQNVFVLKAKHTWETRRNNSF